VEMAEPPKVECPICYNEIKIGEDYAECPSNHVANVECARRSSESEIKKLNDKLRLAQGRFRDINDAQEQGRAAGIVVFEDADRQIAELRIIIAETKARLEEIRARGGIVCSYCPQVMEVKIMDAANLKRLERIAVENERREIRSRNADKKGTDHLNDAQLEEEFIRRGLSLPNEEPRQNPLQAMRLHIAEQNPGGTAAAVHVPWQDIPWQPQPQQPEGDDMEAAVIAASMRTAQEDEERRLRQQQEQPEGDDMDAVIAASMRTAQEDEERRRRAERNGAAAAYVPPPRQEEDPFFSDQAEDLRRLIDDYTRETRIELTGNLDELVTTLTRFIESMSRMRGEPRIVNQQHQRQLRSDLQAYYIPHRDRQQQRQLPQPAIFDMGFEIGRVIDALNATGGNEEAAIELLINPAAARGNAEAAAAPQRLAAAARGNAGAAAARGNAEAAAAPQRLAAAAVADDDDDDDAVAAAVAAPVLLPFRLCS